MPWQEWDRMERRCEFCTFAERDAANIAELCRRYGISRKTGYKWLARWRTDGEVADRSRRPQQSPRQTTAVIEQTVVALRIAHPTWGGRKLHTLLTELDPPLPGPIPAISTITTILHRHDLIDPAASAARRAFHRFEASHPNDLLQLDFTGHVAIGRGRCHPLPILDDHSRFLLGLQALGNEQGVGVRAGLTEAFRQYGVPVRILCDYGPPWGTRQPGPQLTVLTVWLIKQGIEVIHGEPRHPQTQGKVERLHRTLKADVLAGRSFATLAEVQTVFDRFRDEYNTLRPHQALGMVPPIRRYTPSRRAFQEQPDPFAYAPDDALRKVDVTGRISWHNRVWNISDALVGETVAVRPTRVDGEMEVRFCRQVVRRIRLR
jgi:transposase InsO family protein